MPTEKSSSLSNSSKRKKTVSQIFLNRRGIPLLGSRLTFDTVMKTFFGGNAQVAIVCLLFICLFLIRAAMGFFPGYRVDLSEARRSGVEFVNVLKEESAGFVALRRKMEMAYISEKRARFGDDEAVVFLYNRYEGVVDDHFDDEVSALAEMESGPAKEQKIQSLTEKVEAACLALPESEVEQALSPLGMKKASDQAIKRAVSLAVKYALNDAETPDDVEQISQKINEEMGGFTTAYQTMMQTGKPLQALEEKLADRAETTIALLRRQREVPKRIKALRKGASKIKNLADRKEKLEMAKKLESTLVTNIPVDKLAETFYQSIPEHDRIIGQLSKNLQKSLDLIPKELHSPQAQRNVEELKKLIPAFLQILKDKKQALKEWRHDAPVSLGTAMKAFFFGTEWQTNSSWQDVYGLLPLLTGSLLIAGVSLLIAVPIAIGAALYVNQFSHQREAAFLKPAIEFIQAIPSVVLGLFGVLVLAGLLKDASASPLLSWIPGFPIQERLNVLLASLLLAFMAAPTIFTLAEDALNNVPRAYSEASLAMGATRLQTAVKIVLPAALSGIVAAVLLGFGRIIGETMVVLLVAGNKAAIPDLSLGLGVVTQPVHTMTSIIAQECGEVEAGSLHYMALFMVGLILFLISLSVNSFCQTALKKKY